MHIPTLFVVNVTLSAVVSATLAFASDRRYPELRLWAASLALLASGYGLIGLRNQIPDLVSIVGGNALLAISMALLAEGIYCFQRREPPRLLLWLPLPLTLVGFSWLLNDLGARLVYGGLLIILQLLLVFVPVIAKRTETAGRGQYVILLSLGVALACIVARLGYMAIGHVPASLFDNNLPYSLIYLGNLSVLLLGTVGMILMVQERTQAELAHSERQYRQLIDSAQEGICILSNERCSFANPHTAELLGLPISQLIGARFIDFVHPDDRQLAMSRYAARLTGAVDQHTYDLRLLTAHKGPRWFRISGLRIQWHKAPATLTFFSDIHERKLMEDQIRQLAYHDELTQLPNRRLLMDRLQQALALHQRSGRHVALMFIDLDRLKVLNDLHGHQAGDQLLIEVGRRLQAQVREGDTVARLGGDEYVVLLQQLDADETVARNEAQSIGEKILGALSLPYQLALCTNGQGQVIEHRSSASIGITLSGAGGKSGQTLLEQADAAMYQAKQAGRGVLRFGG
ncbi:MAG: diguanylate cyclase [Alcaligenaceae bacterium]|nr:diguanylate cyclase [Alcaligenaceae bacterium]